MKNRPWSLGLALAVALLASKALVADEFDEGVRGRLASVNVAYGARGEFHLDVRRRDRSNSETILMNAGRVGTAPDVGGAPAEYHAVLIDSSGSNAVDFGAARLDRGGHANFRFDSRRDDYPAGVSTITAFGGGTFELRRDGAAVLRGDVPQFVGLGDQSVADSFASFHGASRLAATIDGGAGRGAVDVRAMNSPNHVAQRLRISVRLLGTLGNPFSVVAIDGSNAETALGTIRTHGRGGEGSLTFDTRRAGTIPGGGILALAGQRIEVRNSAGTTVLTGAIPSIP
jgi:hypothetical protein